MTIIKWLKCYVVSYGEITKPIKYQIFTTYKLKNKSEEWIQFKF